MELLQNPYFLLLFFVLVISVGLCIVNHEYIPAFLFILMSGLGAFYQAANLPQVSMLKGTLFPLFLGVVVLSYLKRGRGFPLASFVLLFTYILLIITSSLMNGTDLGVYKSDLIVLLLPFIIALCPDNEKTVKTLTLAIALWGVANLLAAIAELSGVGWKYGSDAIHTSHRVTGLMGHSTYMGIYFVISLNAVHVLFLQAKTQVGRNIWLLLGMCMLLGLLGTLSRGALAAWLVSFLFIQYRLRGLSAGHLLGIAVAAAIVAGVASFMNLDELMVDRFATMKNDPSTQERFTLINMGMKLLDTSPLFGTGLGQAGGEHIEAHNTYMQVLMETGVIGFTAFCLVMWRGIQGLKSHIRINAADVNARPYYVGLLGTVFAILLDGGSHVFYLLVPLWMAIGVGFMAVRKR